jgi:phosphomevalonate kinase
MKRSKKSSKKVEIFKVRKSSDSKSRSSRERAIAGLEKIDRPISDLLKRAKVASQARKLSRGARDKRLEIERLVRRAKAINGQIIRVKALYRELDEITTALVPYAEEIPAHGALLVDNFEEKATAWKSVPFRRFELKFGGE